jgi:hypothetical protein
MRRVAARRFKQSLDFIQHGTGTARLHRVELRAKTRWRLLMNVVIIMMQALSHYAHRFHPPGTLDPVGPRVGHQLLIVCENLGSLAARGNGAQPRLYLL